MKPPVAALALLSAVLVVASAKGASAERQPTPAELIAIFKKLGIHPTTGLNAFRIPSSSMEPTLHCARPLLGCEASTADRVITQVYGHGHSPARGDMVAFHAPRSAASVCGTSGVYVKRVIALPGETWREKTGRVHIGSTKLQEPYIGPGRRDELTYPRAHVPAGAYFLEGDNRAASCDSRQFGSVPMHEIVGKVTAIYWPPGRVRRLSS